MRSPKGILLNCYQLTTALIIFLLVLPSFGWCAKSNAKEEMVAAFAAVQPALIRIHVVYTDHRQGREVRSQTSGSGVIISPDGYAITNHHVAEDAEHIVCTLADKREVDATLVGTDPLSDIAIIKLKSIDDSKFPFASFGDSSKLEVGDTVYAMGSPYALSQSVTMGIVSNVEMIMPDLFGSPNLTLQGEDVGSIVRWIGHDALIEPGNSGGPLVDRSGLIVGINEISYGLSGAIPSNLAKYVAEQLISNGKVIRSWLGLEVQPLLESSNLKQGILVASVLEDSPAEHAGFKSGDVILEYDGEPVTALFREQVPLFNQLVANTPVGKKVVVKVLRDDKRITLTPTTVEREKAMSNQQEMRDWGMCAMNLTYIIQKEMQRDSIDGVMVANVLPSGPAGGAKPSIREGDVIVKVGGECIKDLAHLKNLTRTLLKDKEDTVPVVVEFDRKSDHYATVVKIGKREPAKPGREISKAWLPVDMQVLTRELAKAYGLDGTTGVRITQVYKGSSAEKAGLKVGDFIVKLDEMEIPAEHESDEQVLPTMIRQYDIGAEVVLGVIRDGKPFDLKVTLETSPIPVRDYPIYENDEFQFCARDIAFSDRAKGNVEQDQTGVYITSVADGSWASLGQLSTGDVVTHVAGEPVSNIEDMKRVMKRVHEEKPLAVVFVVRRGIHTHFLEMEPVWSE